MEFTVTEFLDRFHIPYFLDKTQEQADRQEVNNLSV